uniref:non-specific serine/threonine protein kinase n=1 Tax=Opuntia streptacantha TaxID=393608 RepID=A0A7C8ZR49_OPUST
MSVYNGGVINTELSKPTSIFGLRLWVIIGILVGSTIVLLLFLLSLCLTSRSRRRNNHHFDADVTPSVSKEIKEVQVIPAVNHHPRRPIAAAPDIQVEIGKTEHRVVFSDSGESTIRSNSGNDGSTTASYGGPEVSHLGWGRWYTLRELELATNFLADENVIGEGGYGIVYRGVLGDNSMVAVKNLLNNR